MSGFLKVLFSSVLILGLIALRKYLCNPLRKVPGPTCTKFTKIWLLRRIYSKKLHLLDVEAHEQYGKLQLSSNNALLLIWYSNVRSDLPSCTELYHDQ